MNRPELCESRTISRHLRKARNRGILLAGERLRHAQPVLSNRVGRGDTFIERDCLGIFVDPDKRIGGRTRGLWRCRRFRCVGEQARPVGLCAVALRAQNLGKPFVGLGKDLALDPLLDDGNDFSRIAGFGRERRIFQPLRAEYLAARGANPLTGHTVVSAKRARRINALMLMCGHYDGSGEFAYRVGLPGKSGVGGGILCVAPGVASIAVWSPGLNKVGNSLLGSEALEMLAARTGWSVFGA